MAKNPCAKKTTPETCYEVWADASEEWKWFVLKKYQSPEHEALNPYSRWYCAVQSPITNGRFDYGDVYASNVKGGNHRIVNPLHPLTDVDVVELWKLLADVPTAKRKRSTPSFTSG